MSRKTRKLIWSAPLVAVLAVAGALVIFAALTPNQAGAQAQTAEVPGPVSGVNATATSRSSITVMWNAPSTGGAVSGYRLDYSEDAYVWKRLQTNLSSTTRMHTHTERKPDTPYYYRVFAFNSAGTSEMSVNPNYDFATTLAAMVPSATGMLTARPVSDKQIDLMWTPPADNGGADIVRYCISAAAGSSGTPAFEVVNSNCRFNTDPTDVNGVTIVTTALGANSRGTIVVGNVNSYMVNDLTTGLTVRFRVVAVNSKGPSTASNIAVATTLSPAAVSAPPMPTNLKLVGIMHANNEDMDKVDLYWNKPKGLAGTAVTVVQFSEQPSGNRRTEWADITSALKSLPTGHAQATYERTEGFRADGEIRFRVRYDASTGGRQGGYSNTAMVDTPLLEVENLSNMADATPVTFMRNGQYLNRIEMEWMYRTDTDNDSMTNPKPTGYVLDTFMTDDVVPSDTTDTDWDPLETNTGYSDTEYGHISLTAGDDYGYRVFPWHKGRYGPPAISERGMTMDPQVPHPVLTLRVTADGQTKLRLDWTAPASTGGSAITGYLVQRAADIDDDHELVTVATETGTSGWIDVARTMASVRTHTYDGKDMDADTTEADRLEGGSARWFRVIALNSKNTDPDGDAMITNDDMVSADPVRGETMAATLGMVPSVPLDLTAEKAKTANSLALTDLGVLLLWNEPASPGNATEYVIYRKVDDGDWMKLTEIADDQTYYTDTAEPTATEQRTYRVTAKNMHGESDDSNMAYHPAMAGTGALTEPTNVTAMSDAAGMVTVSWTPGANAFGHLVLLFQSDFSGTPMVGTPTGNSHMVSDVPAGSYIAVVVSYRSATDYKYMASGMVTVE